VIGWSLLLLLAFSAYLALGVFLLASMSGTPLSAYFKQIALSHSILASIPLFSVYIVGYLALALAFNVVMRIYLSRDLWARVVASTVIHGIEAAADVAAKGDLANALGEGFADGLDVAGF
jgi:uncharacterized membrane protein